MERKSKEAETEAGVKRGYGPETEGKQCAQSTISSKGESNKEKTTSAGPFGCIHVLCVLVLLVH